MPQKPKIAVSSKLKNNLDRLKKPDETYEKVITSLLMQPLYPQVQTSSQIVGAGTGEEAFSFYSHTLRWISDTEKKLPHGGQYEVTPEMREEAYDLDPLVSGIITPFLKNILLGKYNIITDDNKKYENAIEDIKKHLAELKIMEVLREDFEDYAIKHGHSYRRKDYIPGTEQLKKLQRLEARAMNTYEDPWDSNIKAYHQRIFVNETWGTSTVSVLKEINNWFIPDGKKIIESEGIEEEGAREIWDKYCIRYNISETSGLRVGDAANIISMHKTRPGKSAPIDRAILAIWLKRLILANGPNFIFRVLSPFIHIKNGVLLETTTDGQKQLITSVPMNPPDSMQTTDPEKYTALKAAYSNWITACKNDANNTLRYMAEGGVFASGPDKELNVIESGRSIPPSFIQIMISQLNEDIGQAFGFPVSLIMARGTELATTRAIQDLFNTVYAGSRQEYENIVNQLIKERFEGQTWDYEITTKLGEIETGTYSFDEIDVKFELDTGDVKDALKEAQKELAIMQMLQVAKNIGASKPDLQALADERGFGILDLEKYDTAGAMPQLFGTKIESGKKDEAEAEKLKEDLMKAYQEAKEAIVQIFE